MNGLGLLLSSLLEVELHDGETEQERKETSKGNVHHRDEPQLVMVEAKVFCDELCHRLAFFLCVVKRMHDVPELGGN